MDNFGTRLKNTLAVRLYAFLKIPLLWWVRPSLLQISEKRTVFKIPLSRRTQNHLGVMYFGALAMGAEAAVAIKAIRAIQKCGQKVDFIFKDFHADFHKRAEGDVHFVCDQGLEVEALVQQCLKSKQRETASFESYALVPSKSASEKVATFKISLSVKPRAGKSS